MDGGAPVGVGQVRAGGGGVQGQADRRLPRLRRHALAHRRRPRRRIHVRHDAAGGPQRRQALPDGDRQRPVPRQGVRVREAGGAVLRRQPRHGHQGPRQGLPAHQGRQGQGRSLSAGQQVPAHDRAGARIPDRADQVHPGGQGREQQVLRLRPLQMRRRGELGRIGGGGQVGAPGLPAAEADPGAHGVRGPAHHQVGQGQGARVPPRVAGLRRLRRRAPRLHRRRPHRRGRLQGAPPPRPGRRHPRLQAP